MPYMCGGSGTFSFPFTGHLHTIAPPCRWPIRIDTQIQSLSILILARKGRARIVNALINSHQTMDMACAPASWLGPLGSSGKCSSRRSSRGRRRHPTEKSAEWNLQTPPISAGISTSRFHHPDSALFAQMLSFPIIQQCRYC
jgi:hypothetical protein